MNELTRQLTELSYALDTFYFLISGILVMWMAAGFAMLEVGLVRSKTPQRFILFGSTSNVEREKP